MLRFLAAALPTLLAQPALAGADPHDVAYYARAGSTLRDALRCMVPASRVDVATDGVVRILIPFDGRKDPARASKLAAFLQDGDILGDTAGETEPPADCAKVALDLEALEDEFGVSDVGPKPR